MECPFIRQIFPIIAPLKEVKAEAPVSKMTNAPLFPSDDCIFVSPLARKLGDDDEVPPSSIEGTWLDGRIIKSDFGENVVSKEASKARTIEAAHLDYTDLPHSQIREVIAIDAGDEDIEITKRVNSDYPQGIGLDYNNSEEI